MVQHTSTLWLPDALRSKGVNVVELAGWREAQDTYYWTDIDTNAQSYGGSPTCYMIHHTAGISATPVVKNSSGVWSKANCWVGLLRDGKLYQSGGGTPTIVFTSAGPAHISSGYGHGPTLYEVANDVRVPWRQSSADISMAANRYAWNVETVARGDGTPIDDGVEHALIVMGALLCNHYGWSPWRAIGHVTWTIRKIDPTWNWESDRIVFIQDAIAELMTEEDDMTYRDFALGWFDSLTDEEFDLMDTYDLFDGSAAWWKTLRDKGSDRTEQEDGYCIHFRNTNEITGWSR